MLSAGSAPITAEWRLDETITRYPSTGAIFLQGGRLYVAEPGQLSATYPGLTLGEYATRNALVIERLLDLLNAAAEAERFARRTANGSRAEGVASRERERTGPIGSIGYTVSYREPSRDIADASMISVLEARGPD